jgi:hypothetical protein
MAYARIKVWIPGETLTASDLNSEFTGCIANDNDLGTKLTAEISARTTLESEHDTLRTEFDTLDGNVWDTDQIAADAVKTDSIEDLAVTDAKVATANKDGAAATVSMRTLGTGEFQACAGNDSRLSDTRTPTDESVSIAKLDPGTVMLPWFDKIDGTEYYEDSDSYQTQVEGFRVYIPAGATTMRMEARIRSSDISYAYVRFFVGSSYSVEGVRNNIEYSYITDMTLDVSALSGWYTMGIQLHKSGTGGAFLQGFSFRW